MIVNVNTWWLLGNGLHNWVDWQIVIVMAGVIWTKAAEEYR